MKILCIFRLYILFIDAAKREKIDYRTNLIEIETLCTGPHTQPCCQGGQHGCIKPRPSR